MRETCEHDYENRLVAVVALRAELAKPEPEPVAWVRFCSDGQHEGPLMNESMELTRKISGVWTPLYRKEYSA